MSKCKKCGVPLSGFLSKVSGVLFKVKQSDSNPEVCNKCVPEAKGKYICQICNREIDESVSLMHVKTEEYLLELIRKDHPEWKESKDTCHKCVTYYRELVKKAEI